MHRPEDIEKVLKKFPVEDVWGIGRRSAPKLHACGVRTAYDFTTLAQQKVQAMFGITGVRTWRELRGEPCIDFEVAFEAKQSICVSRSFSQEIAEADVLCEQVANFASSVAEKLRQQRSVACEILVFAYTNRFKDTAPQMYGNKLIHFEQPTNEQRAIVAAAVDAARTLATGGYSYKKAGVVATRIMPVENVMHSLFEDRAANEKEGRISTAVDVINSTFGRGTVKLAVQGSGKIKSSSEKQSPHYTTLWSDIPTVTVK